MHDPVTEKPKVFPNLESDMLVAPTMEVEAKHDPTIEKPHAVVEELTPVYNLDPETPEGLEALLAYARRVQAEFQA